MVTSIRQVKRALGSPLKTPSPCEPKNRQLVREGLAAPRTIAKGAVFSAEKLGAKRPGTGISPARYWEFLSKRADRDYQEDEFIAE